MRRVVDAPVISALVQRREREETLLTFEEYLALEEISQIKHEFAGGRRFAMSGALEAHNVIAGNAFAASKARLRGGPCRVFNSDMMVRIESLDTAYYPDVHVQCGQDHSPTARFHTHPAVIIEVLSPSTARFDRGAKFEDYLALTSLRSYVLASSERRVVEVRRIDEAGEITTTTLHDGDEIHFPELGIAIPVAELYEDSGIEAAQIAPRS
jgi:Uma2 family endonuclease